MQNLVFKSQTIIPVIVNNLPYLMASQIGAALGYARPDKINSIYQSHRDEFTNTMTFTTDLVVLGQNRQVRVFSLRGCHLLAMFSKTPVAKEFRHWVLDLIERQNSVVRENRTTENNIRSAVRQELAALASESATDTNVQDMRNLIAALMNNIIDGRVKNQYRHLVDENAALKEKLAAIKKAVA